MDINNNGYPFIDAEDGLRRLRNNTKLYNMMLMSFQGDRKSYDSMLEAIAASDLQTAQFHAHTIKGVVANLSLKYLTDLIVPFEAKLKQGVLDEAAVPEIKDAYEGTLAAIAQYLSR